MGMYSEMRVHPKHISLSHVPKPKKPDGKKRWDQCVSPAQRWQNFDPQAPFGQNKLPWFSVPKSVDK